MKSCTWITEYNPPQKRLSPPLIHIFGDIYSIKHFTCTYYNGENRMKSEVLEKQIQRGGGPSDNVVNQRDLMLINF